MEGKDKAHLQMTHIKTGPGFSIELEHWKLKRRGIFNELPEYEVIDGKVTAIAIVDEPAIQRPTMINLHEKSVSGPIMIPEERIYRTTGPNNIEEECYWYFTKEIIAKFRSEYKGKLKLGH